MVAAEEKKAPREGGARNWRFLTSVRQRESSDNPILNAFCLVAPSVRFNFLAIRPAGVFLRAIVFRSRTCTDVQARLFDPFFMRISVLTPVLVAESRSKEKPRAESSRGEETLGALDESGED